MCVRDEHQWVRFLNSSTVKLLSISVNLFINSLSRPDTTSKNETSQTDGQNQLNSVFKEPSRGLLFVVTNLLVVFIPYFLLLFITGGPPPGVHGEYGLYRTLRLGLMALFSISYCALIYHLVCYSPRFRVWLTGKLLR